MKKILSMAVIGLGILGIASCSKNSNEVSKKDIYGPSSTGGDVSKYATGEVLFKKNSTVPYLSLEDGVALMSVVRSANLDDQKYKFTLKKDNNDYVISNETGASCVLNLENQTLTFEDYDKFAANVIEEQKPLSLVTIKKNAKALKMISSEYTKGEKLTVDLKPYSKLDIYTSNDKCYLPLSVFNGVLFNVFDNVNIAYNGKDLFLVPGGSLVDTTLGVAIPTALGEKFSEGAAKESISDEYKEYYYQSLCFDFNYQYGLKDKFTSFDEFLKSKKFNDKILSNNPKDIDNYTTAALTYLNDGHTALSVLSNMYDWTNNTLDETLCDPKSNEHTAKDEAFTKAYSKANIKTGLDYSIADDTVFVTFKSFTNIDADLLYESTDKSADEDDFTGADDIPGLDFGSSETEAIKELNTAYLFNKLYKDLTSTYKNKVKNIVVDLTANEGGSADGLMYSLSTLIGNVKVDMTNGLTKGHNQQVYKADMNADGVVDDKDVSLSDLGYKIYFLNSEYSFSSANAMPVIAKLNKSSVVNLGFKTAGGPCAVRNVVTPIGSVFSASSLNTISKLENGKYVNIDGGVEADYKFENEAKLLDRDYIVSNLSTWK